MFAVETHNLHPSTLLCLRAMQTLPDNLRPARVIDLGCGSGVLAIVAAHLWPEAEIEAVDISANAVADTKKAAKEHGVEDRLNVHLNDVFLHFKGEFAHSKGAFDLMLCNMLADIVIPLAPDIKKNVRPGGYAVVAGLLAWKAAQTAAVLTGLGFEIVNKYEDSPWVCYTLCHKTETIEKPGVTKG